MPQKRNSFLKAFRHRAEYLLCAPAICLIRAIPAGAACRVAGFFADLAFLFLARRRRIAIDNILAAGITDSRKEASRIARASFRHMSRVIAESFHSAEIRPEDIDSHFELDVPKATHDLLRDPSRGFILYSGHIGNWEVAATVISLVKPVTGIQRPMDNPYVQALLGRSKMRGGFETIDKHGANPRELVGVLRKGRVLAILADQHATNANVWIDFLGRPASTYVTPAVLHLLTGAPIVYGVCAETDSPMHFKVHMTEPLAFERTKDRKADIERITRSLSDMLAASIRAMPEQYLWAHKRWRTPPANPA